MSDHNIPVYFETRSGEFLSLEYALLLKPEKARELLTSKARRALLSTTAKLAAAGKLTVIDRARLN